MSTPRCLALAAVLLLLSTNATARPRLGVLVVFDQLPSWLLERYEPFFPGGFGGLDGARFDAYFAFAGTETAPGHATLSTCALPAVHGIATNSWFHDGKKLYAVDDPAFPTLMSDGKRSPSGRSPSRLMVNTLGDAMKSESGGRARVVTLSHKDRAAILTAGHAADLAVWYDNTQARFTTSTAYAEVLPPWLEELGLALPTATIKDGTWTAPLPLPKGLEWMAPVDDRPGEAGLAGFDKTFPHDLKDVAAEHQKQGYRLSPGSIADLFTLALRAVDEEKLGADDEPDLLVVSVSTTDVVGHNYGPESLEQLDTLRRADVELRRFLKGLETRIGRNNLVVGLSSDHGAPQLPQGIAAAGLQVATVSYDEVIEAASKASEAATGKKRVRALFAPQLFLDEDDLDAAGKQKLRDAIEKAVEAVPGVAQVYQMTGPGADEDGYGVFMRGSYSPGRSAPIFVRMDPRVVLLEHRGQATGTDHGSVYVYDRRVPFVVRGPGVRRGRSSAPVDTRDVAPTLAFLLGVSPPDSCQGRPVPAVGER